MRGLFRSALALCTLGLAMIGCSRSGSSDSSNSSEAVEAPYQAAFKVPGMS
jgi:hypothetical protein